MNKTETKKAAIWLFALKYNYIFWIAILSVMLIKSCVKDDSIDYGNKTIRNIERMYLADSSGNGFNVSFSNKMEMTQARIMLLAESPSVRNFFNKVRSNREAAFPNLVETDPYEITDWIKTMDIPDSIEMTGIEGTGDLKLSMYLRPNPNDTSKSITNSIYVPNQGMVYLDALIINQFSMKSPKRVYRYKRANDGLSVYSEKDEMFSHVSRHEAAVK